MCRFLFSKQTKNDTKTISKRQIKLCKLKRNSVKVQPLSLYRNEVRWRKQNTAPYWRKQITVGAILDL